MSAADSKLIAALEATLRKLAVQETGELSAAEFARLQGMIRWSLDIKDSLCSRNPSQIAEFIHQKSWPAYKEWTERWLVSLSEEEMQALQIADVLLPLQPGTGGELFRCGHMDGDIRMDQRDGIQAPSLWQPVPERKLVSVLEAILTEQYADEETGLLPVEEAQRVRRLIRDYLCITDSPDSRDPYQIADWIYWNCESASSDATERYLAALTEEQIAKFQLGDVLSCLSPGQYSEIEELADEAEAERRGE